MGPTRRRNDCQVTGRHIPEGALDQTAIGTSQGSLQAGETGRVVTELKLFNCFTENHEVNHRHFKLQQAQGSMKYYLLN